MQAAGDYPILFRNDAVTAAPPFAVLRITGFDRNRQCVMVDQPDDDNLSPALLLINGQVEVASGEFGQAAEEGPVLALTSGSPAETDALGTSADQWYLLKDNTGFVAWSDADDDDLAIVKEEGGDGGGNKCKAVCAKLIDPLSVTAAWTTTPTCDVSGVYDYHTYCGQICVSETPCGSDDGCTGCVKIFKAVTGAGAAALTGYFDNATCRYIFTGPFEYLKGCIVKSNRPFPGGVMTVDPDYPFYVQLDGSGCTVVGVNWKPMYVGVLLRQGGPNSEDFPAAGQAVLTVADVIVSPSNMPPTALRDHNQSVITAALASTSKIVALPGCTIYTGQINLTPEMSRRTLRGTPDTLLVNDGLSSDYGGGVAPRVFVADPGKHTYYWGITSRTDSTHFNIAGAGGAAAGDQVYAFQENTGGPNAPNAEMRTVASYNSGTGAVVFTSSFSGAVNTYASGGWCVTIVRNASAVSSYSSPGGGFPAYTGGTLYLAVHADVAKFPPGTWVYLAKGKAFNEIRGRFLEVRANDPATGAVAILGDLAADDIVSGLTCLIPGGVAAADGFFESTTIEDFQFDGSTSGAVNPVFLHMFVRFRLRFLRFVEVTPGLAFDGLYLQNSGEGVVEDSSGHFEGSCNHDIVYNRNHIYGWDNHLDNKRLTFNDNVIDRHIYLLNGAVDFTFRGGTWCLDGGGLVTTTDGTDGGSCKNLKIIGVTVTNGGPAWYLDGPGLELKGVRNVGGVFTCEIRANATGCVIEDVTGISFNCITGSSGVIRGVDPSLIGGDLTGWKTTLDVVVGVAAADIEFTGAVALPGPTLSIVGLPTTPAVFTGSLWMDTGASNVIKGVSVSPFLTSLEGWWELSEAAGAPRADSTGNTNLTDHNGVLLVSGAAPTYRAARFLEGSSMYLEGMSNSHVQAGDFDFTIAAIVLVGTTNSHRFAGKETEYFLDYNYPSIRFVIGVGGVAKIVASAASLSTWYTVIGWHDAAADLIHLEVNGVAATPVATGGGGPTPAANAFAVGSQAGGAGDFMDGMIQKVGWWKKILSADERAAFHALSPRLVYPF